MITGSRLQSVAYGKVILLGEHAVVYGHTALAAALDRGVRCSFEGLPDGPIRISIPHWNVEVSIGEDHPVALAVQLLARETDSTHLSLSLRVVPELPAGQGLGSSAALCVAVARTLAMAAGRKLTMESTLAIADAGEKAFHQNPSGIDVALAAGGGIGLYRVDTGLSRIEVPAVQLLIGLSGESRRTADMVARVRSQVEAGGGTSALLASLGEAAERGGEQLKRKDYEALGGEFQVAQEALASLGLSTRTIDGMVETAMAAGSAGAKLTGAGGGGAVIALGPSGSTSGSERVLEAWKRQGREAFAVEIGGECS